MPTINRPQKKANNNRPKGESAQHIAELVYNTPMWRNLRKSMLMMHPLCQYCLRELATEVHHVKPLSSAKDDAELLLSLIIIISSRQQKPIPSPSKRTKANSQLISIPSKR